MLILRTEIDKFALLQQKLEGGVARSVQLAPFTSFGIGGPALYFYRAKTPRQLVASFNTCANHGIRIFVLGGGSNILFSDEGFKGLVVKDECHEFVVEGELITAQSGVLLNDLVDIASQRSLGGLEFAAGIPGTVGGAVFGNAGAFGKSIADVLESAVICSRDGRLRVVDNDYFQFVYRGSHLKKSQELVLSASFKLVRGEKEEIAARVEEHRQLRRAKHPIIEGSAGSTFKNVRKPKLIPAGVLLEEAGARGLKVGEAEVFKKHCNIIVNTGRARAADVKKLAGMMHNLVLEKHGINLEYELMIIEP